MELRRQRTRWADRLRAYTVELDGEVVGTVGNGESKQFDVRPGVHEMQLRLDWGLSLDLSEIVVASGGGVRHGR